MEFNEDIKKGFIEEINTLKNMLDKLATEINNIESGNSLEFIAPLMQARSIEGNIKGIIIDIKAWQNEDTEYSELP